MCLPWWMLKNKNAMFLMVLGGAFARFYDEQFANGKNTT